MNGDTPDVAKLAAEMRARAELDLGCIGLGTHLPSKFYAGEVLTLLDAFDARGRDLDQANARADKAEHDLARLTVNAGQRLDEKDAEIAQLRQRVCELEQPR